MNVLENTTGNPFPTQALVISLELINREQGVQLVTGLNLPTALACGPDDNLYVSNWGFGPPALGGGEILKIEINCEKNWKEN